MRAMRATVVYVPMCSRTDLPKACQLLNFTCQRANKCASVTMCQRRANFSIWRANVPKVCQFFNLACQCAKRRANISTLPARKAFQFFNYFSKENIFQFLNFSLMLNISKIQEFKLKSGQF